jgi:hypothetical protein
MTVRMSCFVVLCSLSMCVEAGIAQDQPPSWHEIALTVQPGVPIHVALEKSVPIKDAGVPVEGHVVEPVYVFDHLVIPVGSKVLGHVTQVDELSRKQRALTIANGDFTPIRRAHLGFDTLVLKDGRQLPLDNVVSQGIPNKLHLTAGEQADKKKGGVSGAVEQARREVKTREQRTVKEMTAPDRAQRVKAAFAAELPYHKQSLSAGTQFTAELRSPLELGTEDPSPEELEQLGSEIPRGSVVRARLVTPLSSATDHSGSPVQAVVSEPLFSFDRHLILPEGALLQGNVTEATPARWLGRNGQLRFLFRQVDVPDGASRELEAGLEGAQSTSAALVDLTCSSRGFLPMPSSLILMPRCKLGRPQAPAGGTMRGAAGFGLVGRVVFLLASSQPVTAGFAFYGVGLSVYSHAVARGTDATFPKNTLMEIRFATHEGPSGPSPVKASPEHLPPAEPALAKLAIASLPASPP